MTPPKLKYHRDDRVICEQCKNYKDCKFLCYPLTWINGNSPLKEKLAENDLEAYEYRDYKDVLVEMQEGTTDTEIIERIIDVPDLRLRAIYAMIAVLISRGDIADLLHISRQHLNRLIQK